jgi:hypothetical protein
LHHVQGLRRRRAAAPNRVGFTSSAWFKIQKIDSFA